MEFSPINLVLGYDTVSFLQDWWQARRMDSGGNEVAAGLIPSRNRWEKRMKSRDKGVQWNDGMGTGKRTGSLKKMPFLKVSSASDFRIQLSHLKRQLDRGMSPACKYHFMLTQPAGATSRIHTKCGHLV